MNPPLASREDRDALMAGLRMAASTRSPPIMRHIIRPARTWNSTVRPSES